MQSLGHIHVISCGIEKNAQTHISAHILSYIQEAEHIFASQSLLSRHALHIHAGTQHVHRITSKAKDDARHALALCREGKRVVVLASGDALYNGIGGTLLHLRTEEAMSFHPHITAFQALFHTLALPWSGVSLFSVHAQERIPVRRIAGEVFSLIYGGTQYPASHIAQALIDFQPQARHALAVLAECLGSEEERICVDTLEVLSRMSCHATSMLLVLPVSHYRYVLSGRHVKTCEHVCGHAAHQHCGHAPILPLGLPEDTYERDKNLITASDIRAVILARLRLPAWGTLWDIGAGSGSVGLEAAGLCPHLKVLALEQKEERLAHMHTNQHRMGVCNYHAIHTHAVDFLRHNIHDDADTVTHRYALPDTAYTRPDRIFIGGGGADIAHIIELCLAQLHPEGLLVVSAVTLESFYAIAQCAPESRVALSSIHIAHEQSIAREYHALKNQNTIYIFTFCPQNPHREAL